MPEDSGLAAVLLQLAEFSKRLAALESRPAPGTAAGEPGVYEIRPAVHWWSVNDEQRDKAIAHLKAWVEQVYRPHYGHLAAALADCWPQHKLCLVQLDWLSELHGYLYFSEPSERILAAQAEYGTRIIPAVSEQFRMETLKCAHRKDTGSGWRAGNGA